MVLCSHMLRLLLYPCEIDNKGICWVDIALHAAGNILVNSPLILIYLLHPSIGQLDA
jgi:hypothetical protein